MENYKRVEIVEDTLPTYELQGIIQAINNLGYKVSEIMYNEGAPTSEEDYLLASVTFKLENLPIIHATMNEEVRTELGGAQITIFAVETTKDGVYYIEDIISSNFIPMQLTAIPDIGVQRSYKSYALDSIFHALLKTLLVIVKPKS